MQNSTDIEFKLIDYDILNNIFSTNNWTVTKESKPDLPNVIFFVCKNLNPNSYIKEINIQQSSKYDSSTLANDIKKISYFTIIIFFTPPATLKLADKFHLDKNDFEKFRKKVRCEIFNNIPNITIHSDHFDNNIIGSLHFSYKTFKEHLSIIHNFIAPLFNNDITQEMWEKLMEILPFLEKTFQEKRLEKELKANFSSLSASTDYEKIKEHLTTIVSIAEQLSEMRSEHGIFYNIAKKLNKIGFGEQAKEILDKTIMASDIKDDLDADLREQAATLIKFIILNRPAQDEDSKIKNAQEAIKYCLAEDNSELSNFISTFKVMGKALGNEAYFDNLLEEMKSSFNDEDYILHLAMVKAIKQMTDTIYYTTKENIQLKEDNQALLEKNKRLEAELARIHASQTSTLVAYNNTCSTSDTLEKETQIEITTQEQKTNYTFK